MDMALNMEGIIEADNSVFLSKENVSVEAVSLEEFTFSSSDKVEQEANKVEQEADKVEILSLLSCDQCQYDCETQDELKNHIDSIHGNFLIMDCKCKFTTNEENVLKVHNESCHKGMKTAKIEPSKQIDEETELGIVICGECNKVFPSISECEEHMKDHTWQCYKCNLTLESKEDLSKHEVNQHIFRKCDKTHIDPCKILPVKEFNCNDGDLNLNSQKEKDIHKYEHTKISDVKQASTMINCDQCDYTSPDVKAFVSHILSTHAETGGTCGRCGYRSVTRERLQNHMVEEHADL